jgi:hypothetical protein
MKNLILISLIASAVFSLNSCSKPSSGPSTNAGVMFVHGCASGTGALDVLATSNGATVSGASNIAFLQNSGYQNLAAGANLNLAFKVTGLNSTLSNGTETLIAGNHYSAFAGGIITNPSFVFSTDDLSPPTSGNAKIRFVNLSPDTLNLNCYFATLKIDSGVAMNTCSGFVQIPANSGTLFIQDITNNGYQAQISNQTLSAGKIYTALFTGTHSATGGSPSVFTITLITNQ